jgi:hypothetical protein
MNKKLSALLSTAIVSGLLAAQVAHADDADATKGAKDQVAAEKNSCKGQKAGDKNSCKGQMKHKKEMKKKDKNSCKNGCGNMDDKKDDSQKEEGK